MRLDDNNSDEFLLGSNKETQDKLISIVKQDQKGVLNAYQRVHVLPEIEKKFEEAKKKHGLE